MYSLLAGPIYNPKERYWEGFGSTLEPRAWQVIMMPMPEANLLTEYFLMFRLTVRLLRVQGLGSSLPFAVLGLLSASPVVAQRVCKVNNRLIECSVSHGNVILSGRCPK